MKSPTLSILAVCLLASCASQAARPPLAWGVDVEVYPAGAVVAARVERELHERSITFARVGYNATERDDFGEHDDESGGGPGFGFGYRRWLRERYSGLFWGLRADLWWLEVDWEDNLPGGGTNNGTSDIVVFQPVAQGGYSWLLDSGTRLDMSASLGAEINVDTDGDDVGEGAIFLLGLTWAR
jgi:hypothetical protein